MKRVQPVAQRHDWGCGAACVAAVLGISYAQALKELGTPAAKAKGFRAEQLRKVLNRAVADSGLEYEIDRPFIGDPESLETGSIVALDTGAFLVRDAEG